MLYSFGLVLQAGFLLVGPGLLFAFFGQCAKSVSAQKA
jgi:hypothetical protein